MAATPPLVTSDLLNPSVGNSATAPPPPRINETREGIASVISTIRAQIADSPLQATGLVSQHQQQSAAAAPAPNSSTTTGTTPPVLVSGGLAGLSPKDMSAPLPLARSVSASTSASNGLAADVTERSDSAPTTTALHHLQQPHGSSPRLPEGAIGQVVQSHGVAMAAKGAGERGQGSQNGTPSASDAPGAKEKSKAYAELLELVQRTDASVVRQVVRENWNKCLVGSDYHSAFIANATITCCSPAVLSRTVHELGEKIVKTSKREVARHFSGEDLEEVADLIGPKLSAKFQDMVMANRLESIGAQDLINALARAERLGYHVNDIVEKKPGPGRGGESVIPSTSTLPPSRPPMPPMQAQGPPHQAQPYKTPHSQNPVPVMATRVHPPPIPAVHPQPPQGTTPIARMTQSTSNQSSGIVSCQMCHRPCSSADALNYHMKRARCLSPKPPASAVVDTCIHCGCHFESSGGLHYHIRGNVCGKHDEKTRLQMVSILQNYASNPPQPPNTHAAPIPHMTPVPLPNMASSTPKSNVTPRQKMAGSVPTPSPSGNDPYAKLTPDERARFDAEMAEVDRYYLGLMDEARVRLPPGQCEEELAKLKNRYNTKQSNTRKKYGIRLRERRTNADMDRSWNATPSDYAQASKKVRADDGQAKPTQAVPQVMESPRRRVPLAEMGGLSASSATAELVDPTASPVASRPPPPLAYNQPAAPIAAAAPGAPHGTYQGTPDDPMQIDDDSSTDSDNVDIPARIKTT